MSKIDLTDVTFTIPIFFDSTDRLENANCCIDFLLSKFNTNIFVYEEAKSNPHFSYLVGRGVTYKSFPLVNDPYFHRTKLLNYMCLDSITPICVNYDSDVVMLPEQYLEATEMIRRGEADFVYPYEGFVKKPRQVISTLRSNGFDVTAMKQFSDTHPPITSWGGALFYKRESFIKAGMENENFLCWGYEDWERRDRFNILGFTTKRVNKPLYHIDHAILINSNPNNPKYKSNEEEYLKVRNMNKEELTNYIKSWNRT
jgi:hypothetical protein